MKEKKKQKLPIIALIVLGLVGIIGGTIAYFTTEVAFPNVFRTKTYEVELTEEFKSPDEWAPGEQTKKVVQAKNTGEVPTAVRVSYTEEWVAADGSKPSITLPDGSKVVELHMPEKDNWTFYDGWYYYNKVLNTGESVVFIDYVTFNPNVNIEYEEENEYTYDDGTTSVGDTPTAGKKVVKTTKKYTPKKNGYAGATYTLTITVQTVQADAYDTIWNVNKNTIKISGVPGDSSNESNKDGKLYFTNSGDRLFYDPKQFDETFMKHVNMTPGSKYTDELSIENNTKTDYKLYFKIKERDQSKLANELLDNISMTVYLDGEKIYEGSAKGLDYSGEGVNLQNAIYIGEYKANKNSKIVVETKFSEDYNNPKNTEFSYIDWVFYASYEDQVIPINPDTGDKIKYLIVIAVSLAITLLGIILFVTSSDREKTKKTA